MDNQQYNQSAMPLPNATAVLILGILSIIGCVCYGIVGLICGIIALVLAGKDIRHYRENPSLFTKSSFNNITAGRICAFIGIVLSIIVLIITIVFIQKIGIDNLRDPAYMQKWMEQMGKPH